MNFVNFQQMIQDVREWSNQLPDDLVAVAGVPRSGILPAGLLSLHRNLHLVSLEELLRRERPWQQPLRRGVSAKREGRVLIVDDSLDSGATIGQVRSQLRDAGVILYGALYFKESQSRAVDFVFREVPSPRCFEWNLFHCAQMRHTCLDLDGVICEDWLDREEDEGPGLRRYVRHLENAAPGFLPRSYAVRAIVTSRLEKYRPQTKAWLERHGVRYRELVMSPHASAAARRRARDSGRRKAAFYARSGSRLFVESDPHVAEEIASLAKRPVLCVQTMEMVSSAR